MQRCWLPQKLLTTGYFFICVTPFYIANAVVITIIMSCTAFMFWFQAPDLSELSDFRFFVCAAVRSAFSSPFFILADILFEKVFPQILN